MKAANPRKETEVAHDPEACRATFDRGLVHFLADGSTGIPAKWISRTSTRFAFGLHLPEIFDAPCDMSRHGPENSEGPCEMSQPFHKILRGHVKSPGRSRKFWGAM